MKIVNGNIVREGEEGEADAVLSTEEGGSMIPPFFRQTIQLCNTPISYGYLSVIMLISFLFNGVGGLFFTSLLIGGVYMYGQRSQAGASGGTGSGSGGGGGGGMSRMPVRSGGANIKGISDLPKPVSR
jgi:hypothetical protein